jgi:hypothetical protein
VRFSCPYCDHTLNVKNAKPGHFLPKCPKCARQFHLSVEDPERPPTVRALESEATSEPTIAAPPSEPSAVEVPGPTKPAVTADGGFSAAPPRKPSKAPLEVASRLGGYQVLKELGQGGMGAVYLGRQLSLDRLVALKVIKREWANNPAFLARFTREAFAAAQMVHHNVVQIYDIGADRGVNFFSMELVNGRSLMDEVNARGKLDPEAAVGFVLQAARGLKFGHDRGMVHRDVKPDNLLLNDQGIVKVADLGLVKVPTEQEPEPGPDVAATAVAVTRSGSAIGTPSYMAPEQARDAASVDERADIYSLGCTLYVLLTGKPPFEGRTVHEVLSKHASAPVIPPDAVAKRVPKALSALLERMLAKKPEERFPDMGAVIAALEQYLGVQQAGPFTPREEHADALEECVKKYQDAPKAKLRKRALWGLAAAGVLLLLASALTGSFLLVGGVFGLLVLTPLCYFVLAGIMEKTYLFSKVREFVFGSGWSDWLIAVAALAVFLIVLHLFGLLWIWLGFCVAAALVAAGIYFLLDQPLAAQRAAPLAEAEKLLRTMRLHGLEEQALRQFVCKYAGRDWEEFYESLFGYEAKLAAREWIRGEAVKARAKYGAWRDVVLGWVESKQQARQEARQRRHLQAVEAKALVAAGVDAAEAADQAEQMAEAIVARAAALKREAARQAERDDAQARAQMKSLLAAAREPRSLYAVERDKPRRRGPGLLAGLLGMVLGAKVRFLLGAVILAGFLLWLNQNEMLRSDRLTKLGTDVAGKGDVHKGLAEAEQRLGGLERPLELPMVSASVAEWFSNLNAGVAGLLLVLSAFFRGWRVSLLVLPGAAVVLAGQRFGVPEVGPVGAAQVSMGAGMALALLGMVFLRQ